MWCFVVDINDLGVLIILLEVLLLEFDSSCVILVDIFMFIVYMLGM